MKIIELQDRNELFEKAVQGNSGKNGATRQILSFTKIVCYSQLQLFQIFQGSM